MGVWDGLVGGEGAAGTVAPGTNEALMTHQKVDKVQSQADSAQ